MNPYGALLQAGRTGGTPITGCEQENVMKIRSVATTSLLTLAVVAAGVFAQQPNVDLKPNPSPRKPIPQLKRPDLVVTSLTTTGPAVVVNGAVQLPIQVVVKNQGLAAAAVFKVAVEYSPAGGGGPFAVAFDVPGEASHWYPSTNNPLPSGKSVAFSGDLKFNPATHGVRVSLRATADSCSGDEFAEDFCRVRESNEANNRSVARWVVLP
jgi:hypothetical protein